MTVIGVFCRPNHPGGFGGQLPTEYHGLVLDTPYRDLMGKFGAHGYVTWIVRCEDWIELGAVRDLLRLGSEWETRGDEWFSGPLDLVAAWEGYVGPPVDHSGRHFEGSRWTSIGDNRGLAWLTAREVLTMRPTRSGGFRCHAGRDGECSWMMCPQLRDGEPMATRRHCPLDGS